ncbi:Nicastrin [Orchesella cincta]|uniref:Nicastrin n=1 Tax=Orchesella cincta TaxID=48709 RepID=A0A1D2MFT3_ORCCI|nr:Nicastrin [Orchesella cincta]
MTSSAGDTGVLHLVEDEKSLEWVLKTGPHSPYIALLYPEYFTREIIYQFRDSGRVNGVLMMREKGANSTSLTSFSTDSSCPNDAFGIYNATSPKRCQKWNAPGNSLLFENLPFPIFFMNNETESEKLIKCYDSFNRPVNGTARSWPLCASQLKSFMLAAINTPTCLRRSAVFNMNPGAAKVCDPLGDQNIVASLLPKNATQSYSDNSIIVVAARMDGASLFDEISPAADSSISGLVTVLSIMKHLGKVREQDQLGSGSSLKNVYFMLFNGEAFGYIGSSRIVYDMGEHKFPISLSNIRYFIEVNQAAASLSNDSYFIHQSELSQSKELTDLLQKNGQQLNLNLTLPKSTKLGLPPSSLHSFLKERADLTGIVITNHEEEYKNKFYNEIFDDEEKIGYIYGDKSVFSVQQNIAGLSAALTNSLLELLGAPPSSHVLPDLDTVDELLHCYLESANCSIFRELLGQNQAPKAHATYVGVVHSPTSLSVVTSLVASLYVGSLVENITVADECWKLQKEKHYFWMNGSCYDTTLINATEALSPAFLLDNYDWASGKYSTWTESIWQKLTVRIFIKPSKLHEIMTLSSGIVVLVLSMVLVRTIGGARLLAVSSKSDSHDGHEWTREQL